MLYKTTYINLASSYKLYVPETLNNQLNERQVLITTAHQKCNKLFAAASASQKTLNVIKQKQQFFH